MPLRRVSVLLGCRLFGENEKVVENLLSEFVVVDQLAILVGHDEFVGCLAIRDGERIVLVVFHDADDLEFVFFAVDGFDDENVL